MKLKALAAATLALTSVAATSAFAEEAKHFRGGPVVAPARGYVAPAHRGYVAPVVVNRYVAPRYVAPRYAYNHGGYWRNGRWIAPVVVGAALLGTIAAANTYYAPAPVVTYVNPTPTYYSTPVVTAAPAYDTFSQADRNGDGYVDKVEASFDKSWERWFYDIDRNNDGYVTRQEIDTWNQWRAQTRPY